MQRLLSALVAVLSFAGMVSGMRPCPAAAQERPASGQGAASDPVVLPPGVTNENVEVKDRALIIEGNVRGSVHAVNSRVTLMPGARIDGNLTLVGSSLSAGSGGAGIISAGPRGAIEVVPRRSGSRRGEWFGAQFCLWLLGLAGGVVVLVAAPHATSRVAETVTTRPGRSLLAGLGIGAVMFSALAISGLILNTHSFLTLVWMPVGIVIALISLILLMFGWLAGMRRVGDMLASRFGDQSTGTFYARMAIGLTAFFLVNAVLGSIIPPLGAVGLMAEFAVAIMGVGAIVQTGFRQDHEWIRHQIGRGSGSDAR